jgi:Ion channel
MTRTRFLGLVYLATWIAFAIVYLALGPGNFVSSTTTRDVATRDLEDRVVNLVKAADTAEVPTTAELSGVLIEIDTPQCDLFVVVSRLDLRPNVMTEISEATTHIDHCFRNGLVSISSPKRKTTRLLVGSELSRASSDYYSFMKGDPSFGAMNRRILRYLYTSAVIITTLGFGDIVPTSDAARIAIMCEAVLGISIAGLFINAAFSQSRARAKCATGTKAEIPTGVATDNSDVYRNGIDENQRSAC